MKVLDKYNLTCPNFDCDGMPLIERLEGKDHVSFICLNCMEEFYLKAGKLYDRYGKIVLEGEDVKNI